MIAEREAPARLDSAVVPATILADLESGRVRAATPEEVADQDRLANVEEAALAGEAGAERVSQQIVVAGGEAVEFGGHPPTTMNESARPSQEWAAADRLS